MVLCLQEEERQIQRKDLDLAMYS